MRPGSDRWHEVSESEFAHEREGLAHIRDLLPDRAPYHAWSNFEFRDRQGKWHEVDLLVLGESGLHLVELKHYQGTIGGSSYRWVRGVRSEDSPLMLARKKAQRLASVLKEAARDIGLAGIPYVQESVFLHAKSVRCMLPGPDKVDLFGLDGAETTSGLPSIAERLLKPGTTTTRPVASEQELLRVVRSAGFAVRREREVGSWRLIGQPLAEGDGWQDWPAEHRVVRQDQARIRFFVAKPGTPESERKARRHLAEREYALTSRLQHKNVLSPRDLVDHELGVGLVYPYDHKARRLDLWLTDVNGELSLRIQVDVIRQLAEALAYAHGNQVVHRGLNPAAVHVTDGRGGDPALMVSDWQVAGTTGEAGSRVPATGGNATRIFDILDRRAGRDREVRLADAYVAPEGQWVPGADRVRLDVFALGALAYHVVAGREPATSGIELRQRVGRDGGLDLVADVPEVPASLRSLILQATKPMVSDRIRDVPTFLARLSRVENDVGPDTSGIEADPLDAAPGTMLGDRFQLVRRLGSGSTAVGLLVTDRQADDERRVLKVALDDSAARRLADEAEILRALNKRKHARLIRLAEDEALRVGDRTALLLEFAGDETLAEVLRDRPRLSLDRLERWGTDLLEALVALDEAGIDHRDIKPANLGIRKQPSDRAKHLVLFDFSLSKAGAASIKAGTPPYLDPFLGTGVRTNWDSAAERYAAAVTLFEMATGHAPVHGDGQSDPAAIPDEATVEPGNFDPSLANGLAGYFRIALRRDARQRHHTAAEMLAAWRSTLAAAPTTVPDDADALADAATPSTPLAEAGLSARGLSALEPFHLSTAGDLAALDPGRLSRPTGVADPTRREVRSRAKQWRERFGEALTPRRADSAARDQVSTDPLADAEVTARMLVDAAGGPHAPARRRAASVLLGLEGDASAFATLGELAAALGAGGQPQVSRVLAKVRDAWADDPAARDTLDDVHSRIEELLAELDGASWANHLVTAAIEQQATAGQSRIVAGLARAALDRADDKAKGADESPTVARRRRRADGRVMLARSTTLAEAAVSLGEMADRLAIESAQLGDVVVPVGRSASRLRPLWPRDLPAPDDLRLARLAARLSSRTAASTRGELYDRTMSPVDAIRLTLAGMAPSQRLTVDDVRRAVRVKFPGLDQLPGRPALDQLLVEAGTGLYWEKDAYAVPSVHPDTTFVTQTGSAPIPAGASPGVGEGPTDAILRQSAGARSFLVLGVPGRRLERAARALADGYRAHVVNVTEVLLRSLKAEADRRGVPWDAVRAADAAEPDTTPARGLAELIRRCIPQVEQAIHDEMDGAPEGSRPVLLTESAPLARYSHMGILARLADITATRRQAVWLLLPLEQDQSPTLDGVPIPLSYASQFVPLGLELMPATAEGEVR